MTVPPIPLADALRDRYRFERELGRGGMGTVYLVDDLRHERPVALKVLHPELAATLGPERFLREIRLAARLQHPHLLSVHDSGDAAGRLWFTMPYIEGESLRDRLRRDRQLPVEEAVLIAQQAARALDYAHRHGVLHRDIKPENILLTEDGEALVADFGIGCALGAADADERLTETGLVVGTPAYMSPEQASGERQLDGRSDLYSLGCVLYEMLAGEPPFTGPTAQAIVARRLTETPRPLGQARETVTAELEQVVSTALARAPADRHADGAAFAAALGAALGSAGRTAAGPSPTEARAVAIAARPGRRGWIVGIAAAAIAAALAVALFRTRAGTARADQSLVAVAPFDVLDPALALWREGLVDLLSRNLDGAGPLRSVAPTTVIRRWQGRADPESAAELGRRTGAGLALYGSVLRAGPDSVRIRATLYDVARSRPVEEWEVTDGVDRVDRAADSLTIRVLEGLGRTRPIGAVRLAGFGSTSLPALKAFLQGEQHLRRTEWDSALGYYERAIAIDSTFAPALRRASTALGWLRTGTDSLSTAYALRAGAHNHALSPRDSLLVAADSLFASVLQAGSLGLHADSGWGGRLHRVFSTLEQATARYPDDAETWFALGEALNHLGPHAGRPYERQLEAFDRVIALDSAFAPAYIHPIELSARAGPDATRRYLRPYLALTPVDVNADGARLLQRLLDSAGRAADIDGRLQGISDQGLFSAHLALSQLPDSAELDVGLSRFMARHPLSYWPLNTPRNAARGLARALMARGHLKAGYAALPDAETGPLFAEAALLGGVPAEIAAAQFSKRLSRDTVASAAVVAAFPWWAARRDTVSLRRAQARADSLGRAAPPSVALPQAGYVARSAAAYLSLAREDTAGAIRGLAGLPEHGCPACYLDRVTLAQLLVEEHRDQEAWRILGAEHVSSSAVPLPTEILWSLLRGRAAERLGERERALRAFGWVAGMWRNADPGLQPYAAEAREALARLSGET